MASKKNKTAASPPKRKQGEPASPPKQKQPQQQPEEPLVFPVKFYVNALEEPPANQDRVFFHPSDFTRLKLHVGQYVNLMVDESNTVKEILSAWPHSLVQPGAVYVSSAVRVTLSVAFGQACFLSPTKNISDFHPAQSIRLRSISSDRKHVDAAKSALPNARLRQWLLTKRIICRGSYVEVQLLGRPRMFQVTLIKDKVESCEIAIMCNATTIDFEEPAQTEEKAQPVAAFEGVGGLDRQITAIRELLEAPLHQPHLFQQLALQPPRGLLLHGPPGTGKTLLARSVAAALKLPFFSISAPDVISKYYGETEQKLRTLFADAAAVAPSLIFIDEIDAICPKRDETNSELDRRIVATLLTMMDSTSAVAAGVVVIAATNRPNALDSALRRPGRFDLELEIGIPTSTDRIDILRKLLKNSKNCQLSEEQIVSIAERCHGFVGADLKALVNEAALLAVSRAIMTTKETSVCGLTERDFIDAFIHVKPSAMREILIEVPHVLWSDIGGQEETKQRLREAVEWPLKYASSLARLGIRPPKGLLLYGPPGNSKTMMAKALATEAGLNFIAIKGPELFSKWVGDSERAMRDVFRKARQASPSIVFLDEIDAIAVQRGSDNSVGDRVLSQLLTELDGIEPLVNVVVVAATNRPDLLDRALLRPGRIDRILYVAPPDTPAREAIFRIALKKTPFADDVDILALAQQTEGYSGAEIAAVCRESGLAALEEDLASVAVARRHFDKALMRVKPRTSAELLQFYQKYQHSTGLPSV